MLGMYVYMVENGSLIFFEPNIRILGTNFVVIVTLYWRTCDFLLSFSHGHTISIATSTEYIHSHIDSNLCDLSSVHMELPRTSSSSITAVHLKLNHLFAGEKFDSSI